MDLLDAGIFSAVSLAGGLARGLARALPEAWRQRLEARPAEGLRPGWIWVHAVSVGELLLAPGLVARLLAAGHQVHLTTGTPAGLALLAQRVPTWDAGTGRLTGGAFPLDDPRGLEPFLAVPPDLFLALETELWPNLLRTLEARGIPRVVVNGRLTARSTTHRILRSAARRLDLVAARDPQSAEAFRLLGAPRVALGGNLKADLPAPAPLHGGWAVLRRAWAPHPVVVAGNTVEGEEALVLGVFEAARAGHPELRLILAPRKPARFREVAELLAAHGLPFHRATAWPEEGGWERTRILLLDTLGELSAAYGEGTVALVGGGWTWEGGHNPLEPVRWGLPTLAGPGCANFQDLMAPLVAAGRVAQVPEGHLEDALRSALAAAPLRGPGFDLGAPLPDELRGALDRTWELLTRFLPRR